MTKKQSTAELIAQDILVRIQSGEFKPGDRLREAELAERYDVSRGPVREALQILGSRFWVQLDPGKGARVSDPQADIDLEAALIAAALNGAVARLAAIHATAEEIAAFETRVRDIARAAESEISPEDFLSKTWSLGAALQSMSRSVRLMRYLEEFVQGGLARTARMGVLTREDRKEAARLWVDLAAALRFRDSREAERACRAIVERALQASTRVAIEGQL